MLDMKVDRDLMFRFFQNENTEEEADMLGRWLKESEENDGAPGLSSYKTL